MSAATVLCHNYSCNEPATKRAEHRCPCVPWPIELEFCDRHAERFMANEHGMSGDRAIVGEATACPSPESCPCRANKKPSGLTFCMVRYPIPQLPGPHS